MEVISLAGVRVMGATRLCDVWNCTDIAIGKLKYVPEEIQQQIHAACKFDQSWWRRDDCSYVLCERHCPQEAKLLLKLMEL